MDYDFDKIIKLLNGPKCKIYDFWAQFAPYVKSSSEMQKDYNIVNSSNFNIFSSISEIYYRENMHSDILKLILDPATEKIGNVKNIYSFTNLLRKIKPELKINMEKDITIEREKGRIDVLISDKKGNAIIIENKINNAVDQDDQIGRYYAKITDRGFSVEAIVYLTLTPQKTLDIEYSIKNKELRNKIQKLIIPVPIINKDKEVSFSINFLNECIKYAENDKNDISRIYYSEYKELITHLGGTCMTMDLDRDAIKDIYADKEKLANFNTFGNLWDKRFPIIAELINEQLLENDFQPHPDDKKNTLYCRINDSFSFAYHLADLSFGFVYTPGAKKLPKDIEALKMH